VIQRQSKIDLEFVSKVFFGKVHFASSGKHCAGGILPFAEND